MDPEHIILAVNLSTVLFFGLIWLGLAVFLRLKKKKSFVYLFLFTIFFIYIYKVLDYTLFQYQSLLLLKHFIPQLMLSGYAAGESVNLVPLLSLTVEDLKTSLLNILLMVPFGLGLPFITDFRFKKVVLAGMLFSIAIELLQLFTGLIGGTSFRIADINDAIFNTVGAAIGYLLFVIFVRIIRCISRNGKMLNDQISQYIVARIK